MSQDRRMELVEDLIEGLAHGEVADSIPAFKIERMDDGTVLQVDLGDPDVIYIVTVSSHDRID